MSLKNLFNDVLHSNEPPKHWRVTEPVVLFKKGDASEYANYRLIALLNASYKLFASILLNRLKQTKTLRWSFFAPI